MKKVLLALLLLFSCVSAAEKLQNVGISKYAVLEVNADRTPIRDNYNENATRVSHLFKDTVLFADKQTQNYYRIELEPNKYAWINKKFVEVQGIIPDKRFVGIEKLIFNTEKDKYQLKIVTPQNSAYTLVEKGNNLNFKLYDNYFDPIETKILNQSTRFSLSDKFEDGLSVNFNNDKKLFGYGIQKNEDGYLLNIKRPPEINRKRPLKGITVVVDPGHGGGEYGATAFNLKEKDINLQISKKLKKRIEKKEVQKSISQGKMINRCRYIQGWILQLKKMRIYY